MWTNTFSTHSSWELCRLFCKVINILYFSDPHLSLWANHVENAELLLKNPRSMHLLQPSVAPVLLKKPRSMHLLQPTVCPLCSCSRAFHRSPPSASSNIQETKANNHFVTSTRSWLVNGVSLCTTMTLIHHSRCWYREMHRIGVDRFHGQCEIMWCSTHMRVWLDLCRNWKQWRQGTWCLLTQCRMTCTWTRSLKDAMSLLLKLKWVIGLGTQM